MSEKKIEVGDKVKLYLDEIIKENEKVRSRFYHLLDFWQAINGKEGVVERIEDEIIWVRGSRTNSLRRFTRETLRKI
jgi:hypothetical protein